MKTVTTDPVCGMEIESESRWRSTYHGVTYLFCSEGCQRRFVRDPAEFTDDSAEPVAEIPGARRHEAKPARNYLPLIVIVAATALAACAKQIHYGPGWEWMSWMQDFMGFFLVVFAMFKFFDLRGFADGFAMYDLLAQSFRPYGFVYPALELGLGLGYLSHWKPYYIYSATILVMLFGSLGVLRALQRGLDLRCACLGTVLQVPLSTVALVEDLGMALMAGAMLLLG